MEAAKAYDREAIKTRGPHTATNFDVSKYMVRILVKLGMTCPSAAEYLVPLTTQLLLDAVGKHRHAGMLPLDSSP